MMSKVEVLSAPVRPVAERRAAIEAEPLPDNMAALIEMVAADVPDQLAWHFFESDERATYGEVKAAVHALAHGFARHGVRKGTRVAVMLPNISAFPLTWLALGVIGAVMVPVNVNYRERELAYVVNDSEAEFLVLHESVRPIFEAARTEGAITVPAERSFLVDGMAAGHPSWEACRVEGAGPYVPDAPVGHDDLLNIQYTSGTTGYPKGCLLAQDYWLVAGKVNATRDGRIYRRILASTPFFYMDPQWLLLMTFYQRGTLYVAAKQSASRFMSWVRAYNINFCLLPFLAFKQPPHPDDARNAIVRANVYGLPKAMHAAVEERFNLVAREAFGMTELGPTLFMPIEATDMVGSGACGQPGPFRECKVVDAEGRPVKPGEEGEMVVRGKGIFRGYYNRPDATREAFLDGWFRTGDVFRVDERGYFTIVGRTKDMIRRSAENIAAREVEGVLQASGVVMEAAVVGVPDETRGEEIKAYLVLEEGEAPDAATLEAVIAHCQRNLAPFKVPRFYEFRTALPKTPSLKVAKHVLKAEQADLRVNSYDRVTAGWHLKDSARKDTANA
ncbi:acyl--CoA ligase [Aquabacter sp. L1I39]|nr:acyl--CoA ligase [Aquabacter sp. L1I39]